MTKKCGGPTKALTAEKTSESLLLTTKRPFSSSERVLYKLTLVPQSGWPLPRVPLNQGDPPCSFPPWPPGPRRGWAAGSDRFWLLELRVSRTFLDFSRPQLSGHGYPGDAPTVGDWETVGRRGRAGQETLPEPAQQIR